MKRVICALSVAVLLSTVCFAEDKIDLKLRLKAGETYNMKMVQVQDIGQTINGQQMNMKQTQEMVIGMECKSVDANGNMDIIMVYKSMKMAMDGPMGHMEFDSNKPPVGPN
ncbi:MAG: hypothetical protein ABFD79_03490, partial [Phycisphaerales bacterium]